MTRVPGESQSEAYLRDQDKMNSQGRRSGGRENECVQVTLSIFLNHLPQTETYLLPCSASSRAMCLPWGPGTGHRVPEFWTLGQETCLPPHPTQPGPCSGFAG